MHNPKISIIVPVYNVRGELDRCLRSLLCQTLRNIQIILVDDGSTDGSGELCDQFASSDPRVEVLHKSNGGLSSARNAGLHAAKGEWVLYVDSDDYIGLNSCELLLERGERLGAEIVVGDALREAADVKIKLGHESLEDGRVYSSRDYVIKTIRASEFYAPVWLNLYRRDFLLERGLFFVEGILHEDMEMQPRLFLSANRIAYADFAFYHYVDRSSSIMNAGKKDERLGAMRDIYAAWKKAFDCIDDKELRSVLNGHLCRCYLRSCLDLRCREGLGVDGITGTFLLLNSIGMRDRLKAALFRISPAFYFWIGEKG